MKKEASLSEPGPASPACITQMMCEQTHTKLHLEKENSAASKYIYGFISKPERTSSILCQSDEHGGQRATSGASQDV